jgi:hypothetical protein
LPDLPAGPAMILAYGIGTKALFYSSVGTIWTSVTTGISGAYFSNQAIYDRTVNQFIVGGQGATNPVIAISTNGLNWTNRNINPIVIYHSVRSVAFGNNVYLAGGDNGNNIAYSSDSITWTGVGLTSTGSTYGFAYGKGLGTWVAIGVGGVATSSNNGISWISRPIAGFTKSDWGSVAFSPTAKIFVAAGGGSPSAIYSSPDGINWTPRGGLATKGYKVMYHPTIDMFAICIIPLTTSIVLYTSTDGINWNPVTIPGAGTGGMATVHYVSTWGLWFYCGGSSTIYTSSDLTTWNSVFVSNSSTYSFASSVL